MAAPARQAGRNPLANLQARIHLAKKQLGLTDEEYRLHLQASTGKTSSKGMNRREMDLVLLGFVKLGWQPTAPAVPAAPAKPVPTGNMRRPTNWDDPAKNPMYRKIYAMICANKWHWGYVRGTASRMFQARKGEHVVLEFLTGAELHALVSALQIAANRPARNTP